MICFIDEEQFNSAKTYCLSIYDNPVHFFNLEKYCDQLESNILPSILDSMESAIKKFPKTPFSAIINHLYIIRLEDQMIDQELTSELRKKVILALKKDERQRR